MTEHYYSRRQVIEIVECDERLLDELEAEELIHAIIVESSRERVFAPDEVERIRVMRNLVRELEVNLAGVEVIMAMRENMIQMQRQFHAILETLVEQLKHRIKE